jgi:hypothetical protein
MAPLWLAMCASVASHGCLLGAAVGCLGTTVAYLGEPDITNGWLDARFFML